MGKCLDSTGGGTTIPKPEEMVDLNYLASTYECSHLLDSLKGKEDFDPVHQTATMKKKKLASSDDVLRKVESGIDKNANSEIN